MEIQRDRHGFSKRKRQEEEEEHENDSAYPEIHRKRYNKITLQNQETSTETNARSVSALSSRILERIESSMEKMDSSMEEMKSMTAELLELLSPRFCGICMETKINREMFESACPHSFCRPCIRSHVSSKIRDGVARVDCPDPACDVALEPRNCRASVPRRVIGKWERMIIVSESEKMCSVVLDVADHDGDVASAERTMDEKFMKIARTEKWQKCPGCKFYVQRSSGCESIKCRCGHHFCYVCGKNWMSGHICRTK